MTKKFKMTLTAFRALRQTYDVRPFMPATSQKKSTFKNKNAELAQVYQKLDVGACDQAPEPEPDVTKVYVYRLPYPDGYLLVNIEQVGNDRFTWSWAGGDNDTVSTLKIAERNLHDHCFGKQQY